jgi:hypothetical protein
MSLAASINEKATFSLIEATRDSRGMRKETRMALSIAELELQTAEFLPAREVMSSCSRPKNKCCGGNVWIDASDDDTQVNSSHGLIAVTALNFNDTDINLLGF